MRALTFTIPDGVLRLGYHVPLPEWVIPTGAAHVDTLPDDTPVFMDARGTFQLVKVGERIERRPFMLPPQPKPRPKAEKIEVWDDDGNSLGSVPVAKPKKKAPAKKKAAKKKSTKKG